MGQSNQTISVFQGATGGLGDDLFTGIDGSFYSSKNLNIRDNAQSITLAHNLVPDTQTITTIVSKIYDIKKLTTGVHIAVGKEAGIYLKTGATTWVKKTTSTTGDILSVCEFNGYVYRTTATTLNRILITNVATWASEVLNWNALESAAYHPMLVSMGDMYIGNGGKIDKVNILNVYEVLITLDSASVIRKINELGGNIRIVAKPQIGNSVIYLWDGTDNPPDQVIPLIGYDVRQSIMFNGYDYLTTNDGLGILDGYNLFPLKEISTFDNEMNSACVHKNKIYIGSTIGGVYVFGKKNKNYPEVLNLELTPSHGGIVNSVYDVISCVYSDGDDLYVAWSNTSSYGIDKLNTITFYTGGELVTRGYYNRSLSQIKEALSVMAGFQPLLTSQSITLSYSLDGGSWTQIMVLTPSSAKKTAYTDDMFITGTFQYIQFKIELAGPGTNTPAFYELWLTFNDNLNR